MDKIHFLTERESGLATGIKAAALVVALGLFAAVADHALFAPRATAGHPTVVALATTPEPAPVVALPVETRTHAGEVPPHVQAF